MSAAAISICEPRISALTASRVAPTERYRDAAPMASPWTKRAAACAARTVDASSTPPLATNFLAAATMPEVTPGVTPEVTPAGVGGSAPPSPSPTDAWWPLPWPLDCKEPNADAALSFVSVPAPAMGGRGANLPTGATPSAGSEFLALSAAGRDPSRLCGSVSRGPPVPDPPDDIRLW